MLQVKSNPGCLKGDQGLQRKFRKWYVLPFHTEILRQKDFHKLLSQLAENSST